MCGIAGFIKLKGSISTPDKLLIKNMTDLIRHRGPDDEGFYFGESFALGHRRLSILDLSSCGHQPMEYKKKYVIIFNGEIYNYLEIKDELRSKGYSFNSSTDTEVIIAAYDYWGIDCLEKFNGMWSFVLYDKVTQKMIMARDRFGIKPFYYTKTDGFIAFSSEIKAFQAIPGWKAKINSPMALDFLLFGITDHSSETLYSNVYQLRGGQYLTFENSTKSYKTYQWYDINSKDKAISLSFEEATASFERLFFDSINLRLRSDVKVGSCLSGGIDSSSIVCSIKKILIDKSINDIQETVSSCFQQSKFDEQEYIDHVISSTNVKGHKVFPKMEEVLHKLEEITWYQDEPIPSASVFAQYNVFETAKKNELKVMLDGQGADEVFAGYDSFFYSSLNELLMALKLSEAKSQLREGIANNRININNWLKNVVGGIMSPALSSRIKSKESTKNINSTFLKRYEKFSLLRKRRQFLRLNSLSVSQIQNLSIPMLLHNADRMSMAHSIESRLPFLDYRLVEFGLSLPLEFKIKGGWTKYIIRKSMVDIVPKEVLERRDKMGFVTPEVDWIRNNKDMFEKKLIESSEVLNMLVNTKRVKENFSKDLNNLSSGSIYWRIVSMASWVKKFNISLNEV